ncbi:MAG TPA: neuraminidase-like domain-containing protein, partial [Solirubrobacterales bacterium]|nr:neuraminidase-like domain-containing protein [Solirubrobacterales bacterium]
MTSHPLANYGTGQSERAFHLAGRAAVEDTRRRYRELEAMDRLGVKPGPQLEEMLALWAPIETAGRESLYHRLFLGPAFLEHDPAFAVDADGKVLQDATETLGAHAEALRGAAGVSAEELALIVDTLPKKFEAPLSLENVSAVYARAWLARRLRLSVRELLLLIEHTGLDPFSAPEPPAPQLLALLDLLDALGRASLKPGQALYLVWNEDVAGGSAPLGEEVAALARALRADLADVESQFAVAEDPGAEIARSRLALVYGTEAADLLFGLFDGSVEERVPYKQPQPELEGAILAAAGDRISYDHLRGELAYAGVLSDEIRTNLGAVPGVSSEFKDAVDKLHAQLRQRTGPFLARYPELGGAYESYLASAAPEPQRRAAVLAAFLPELVRRRKRQQALNRLASVLGAESEPVEAIADDADVLRAEGDPALPALADLLAVDRHGLDLPSPAAGQPHSGTWSGFLEAPESAQFELALEVEADSVEIVVDGEPRELVRAGKRWRVKAPLPLIAAELRPIRLTVKNAREDLVLYWERAGHGWEPIPQARLYAAPTVEHLGATYARLLKAASLAKAGKLTAAELVRLAKEPELAIGGGSWLDALRGSGQPAPAVSPKLGAALLATLAYAGLKAKLAADDERLLRALQALEGKQPDPGPLLALAEWEADSLRAVLQRFGAGEAKLPRPSVLKRVSDAFDLLTRLGTSAKAALAAVTNEPSEEVVAELQAALRAHYGEAEWLAVLRPINDEMRRLQRDALVACVLRRMSENPATAAIDTPEKLYEHLLMDVEMEPCMLTSRIRHALSSVQLFFERCLMNLETRVAPSSIDAAQWEWMKRYRIWEANRKVFLWPENWLEPELRHDQSPFFKEVMGELLQGDVTEERATQALLSYLGKLEEVARLEPCGLYLEEGEPGAADDVVHVVARTDGLNRSYYYRRREGGFWEAWEKIPHKIDDNPVMPVVWKDRLFVFWVQFANQTVTAVDRAPAEPVPGEPSVAGTTVSRLKKGAAEEAKANGKVKVRAVLCYSERVEGKWQPVKTSRPDQPLDLGEAPATGEGAFRAADVQMRVSGEKDELWVTLNGPGSGAFRLFNTHAAPALGGAIVILTVPHRSIETSERLLTIDYSSGIFWVIAGAAAPKTTYLPRKVLSGQLDLAAAAPAQTLRDVWGAPFFVSDRRHSFYVTTARRL